ncbi:Enoyl-CoA hydratase/carnithine racemase [Frankia canadensis]|uniref:Enoyl-CoA hydratase/carnithine racemase n=1 Tax=Frankia canadensis TaxID=1836972 RepID=A0A2I2KJZ5_9ACTN|nr:enoyl-CoA hydratase-related protein [Frankia canadensis]SNQ45988.1 Enoyl-CoA hydratase/carnithine racemase [Frankia canadensis]SOU53278.1 Enoyl-CoA hydratase/carnithine racemase [Frankia canadensis]
MSDEIHSDVHGGVQTVRIVRPDKRGALTQGMYSALTEAFTAAEADAGVRIIRLCGDAGSFTAGNDLDDFLAGGALRPDGPTMGFLRVVARGTKLLVAEVDGPAVGIGTTVLLHCDLVYATERSRLGLPFVSLGVVPEFGSSLLLPRRVGPAAAARLVYFGEPFGAAEAARLGIVTEVLADAQALRARVDDRVAALLAQPAEALAATRALLHDAGDAEILDRIELEGRIFAERLASAQTQAAIAARMPGRNRGS